MATGLISILKNLASGFGGTSTRSSVGVALQPSGLWIAHVVMDKNRPQLLFCRYLDGRSQREKEARLRKVVQENELVGQPCVGVLSPESYQLFQVRKPQGIPSRDMNKVIRWQVRHLVRFPPQQALFETFPYPARKDDGAPEINVVSASADTVRTMNELIWQGGLKVKAIDINELSLRNILERLPGEFASMVLIHLYEEQGVIMFVCNNDIYLTFRFGVGLTHLANALARDTQNPRPDRKELDSVCGAIATDLKRGLSYYTEQFDAPPVEGVFINAPKEAGYANQLLAQLRQQSRIATQFFDPGEIFSQRDDRLSGCPTGALSAIGAALRLLRRKTV